MAVSALNISHASGRLGATGAGQALRAGARTMGVSRTTSAMEPLTDALTRRLTHQLVLGDASALAALYEARFDWMLALLRRTTRRDESFSLDCAQEAWLRVARSPVRCQGTAPLDAWLRRVALSAALDRVRSDAARRMREVVHAETSARARDAVGELSTTLASIDALNEALRSALEQYEPDARGLLMMRFRAGMTLTQIAASCGVGAAAIDSRLRRLLASLRANMTGSARDSTSASTHATTRDGHTASSRAPDSARPSINDEQVTP